MFRTVRTLNSFNIDLVIKSYITSIKEIPLKLEQEYFLNFLEQIKRHPLNKGPYPDVSLFEASNRIMTDLVMLFGIRKLLNNEYAQITYEEYLVEFGHENRNENDIEASNHNSKLRGEVFNVATSYYQTKKSAVLNKMRSQSVKSDTLLILFNIEALNNSGFPKLRGNEHFLAIDLREELQKFKTKNLT